MIRSREGLPDEKARRQSASESFSIWADGLFLHGSLQPPITIPSFRYCNDFLVSLIGYLYFRQPTHSPTQCRAFRFHIISLCLCRTVCPFLAESCHLPTWWGHARWRTELSPPWSSLPNLTQCLAFPYRIANYRLIIPVYYTRFSVNFNCVFESRHAFTSLGFKVQHHFSETSRGSFSAT